MKPIPGFPGYFASEEGEIYSMKSRAYGDKPIQPRKLQAFLKGDPGNKYRTVNLIEDGITRGIKVSVLILTTFVSPRPVGMYACHGPNRRYDDSLGNLYWATPKRNELDKIRDGTNHFRRGHLLPEESIKFVRNNYSCRGKNGLSARELAQMFSVCPSTILNVVRHRGRFET